MSKKEKAISGEVAKGHQVVWYPNNRKSSPKTISPSGEKQCRKSSAWTKRGSRYPLLRVSLLLKKSCSLERSLWVRRRCSKNRISNPTDIARVKKRCRQRVSFCPQRHVIWTSRNSGRIKPYCPSLTGSVSSQRLR